jgi:hypothetical protein
MARVIIQHPTNVSDNENEHGATQSNDGEEEQQQQDIIEEDSDDDNDDEDCDGGLELCSQHDPRAIAIQMNWRISKISVHGSSLTDWRPKWTSVPI